MAPSGLVRLAGSAFPTWDGAFVWGSLSQRRLVAYDPDTDRTVILLEEAGRVRDVTRLPSGAVLSLRDATDLEAQDGQVVKVSPREALAARALARAAGGARRATGRGTPASAPTGHVGTRGGP